VDDAPVVIIRDCADPDGPALRDLASASIVYAGDAPYVEDEGSFDAGHTPADGMRVAEDDVGLVGMYSLLVRSGVTGVDVELTAMLVAARARDWAVDRLLVQDMRQQATLRDARELTVLTRPPLDVFFREMGGRAVGLEAPWGAITWPRLRVELPV
jgi:hypothetical protein